MLPVSGFFEYGIAALVGAAAMLALGIWSLVADSNREINEGSLEGYEETATPDHTLYKKAA